MREHILRIANKETRFANASISNDNTLDRLHTAPAGLSSQVRETGDNKQVISQECIQHAKTGPALEWTWNDTSSNAQPCTRGAQLTFLYTEKS